jgi:hypothetical protein
MLLNFGVPLSPLLYVSTQAFKQACRCSKALLVAASDCGNVHTIGIATMKSMERTRRM